jgi:hypothetical protein
MYSENKYQLVSAIFLRLIGVFYLIAFISIGVQIEGLAGSQGILPFTQHLAYIETQTGIERYLQMPTLFWLNSSDMALNAAAVIGGISSVMIIFNWLPRFALVVTFILYLSLYYAGQTFMNFQWDAMILEAGFLAIFLTPRSGIIIFLFRFLLFRLRFMSGISKFSLQDPSWSGLTALNFYFEVQPLPTPLAWYAHQLPEWLLRSATAMTLVIEILVPFMMFMPRRWRFTAAWITILWQVLIILTSNHNWFNFLTIALCLFLFDDKAVQRIIPERLKTILGKQAHHTEQESKTRRVTTLAIASLIVFCSIVNLWELTLMQRSTGLIRGIVDYTEAYRIVAKYHVFPTMKTERIELELQGSIDGQEWKPYVFKYKPGDIMQSPGVVVPHQPRLDWQMWFVTLHPMFIPWFDQFLKSLLNNSPAVTALLKHNPFPDTPPRYIRVNAFRYHFSDQEQKHKTGQWWSREALGPFAPLPWIERKLNYQQNVND